MNPEHKAWGSDTDFYQMAIKCPNYSFNIRIRLPSLPRIRIPFLPIA